MNTGREKAILFSDEMVRALLENRKRQTRRVIVPQPPKGVYHVRRNADGVSLVGSADNICAVYDPEYNPGDVLWVRETWQVHDLNDGAHCMMIKYRADGATALQVEFTPSRYDKFRKFYGKNGWQSPYFFPKEAARIFLEVNDTRAQKVQDISEEDARAEGVITNDAVKVSSYIYWFEQLWQSLNGRRGYGWNINPWVWAYTFERIYPETKVVMA